MSRSRRRDAVLALEAAARIEGAGHCYLDGGDEFDDAGQPGSRDRFAKPLIRNTLDEGLSNAGPKPPTPTCAS